MTRAVDVVRRVAPGARPEYIAAFANGDALLIQHGITTPLRLAHFLAQVLHESGGLKVTFENMNYSAERMLEVYGAGVHSAAVTDAEAHALAHQPVSLAERVYGLGNPKKSRELSNTQPGDGYRYRGGGLLQTTGRGNYRRMGARVGIDFESDPRLVISADHALKPALSEWSEGNLNAAADRDDIKTITRRINGGYNGLPERANWLRLVKARAGEYAPGTPQEPQDEPTPLPAPETPQGEPESPTPRPESPSMWRSHTGWSAITTAVTTISLTIGQLVDSLKPLLENPKVLVPLAVVAVAACAFIWWDRRRKMRQHGI